MNVSHEDAQQSLELIQQTTNQTRKAIASSYASGLLILWGLIWIAGFTSAHLWPHRAGTIFNTLNAIGFVATVVIWIRWPKTLVVKSAASSRFLWHIFGLWIALFGYAFLWVLLLRPSSGMLLCTFIVTIAMFGYVVIGLWTGSNFMVWLGLAVTVLTLFGYYLLPGYFYLWMAPTGGGALLGTGLYIRLRWR